MMLNELNITVLQEYVECIGVLWERKKILKFGGN